MSRQTWNCEMQRNQIKSQFLIKIDHQNYDSAWKTNTQSAVLLFDHTSRVCMWVGKLT